MLLPRRQLKMLVAVVAVALLAASCGGTTASNTDGGETALSFVEESTTTSEVLNLDTVVVAARGSIDASPLWVADSEGFFEAEGLDIDFAPGPDETALFQALVDGSANVAVVSVSSAVRRAMFDGDELEFITYLDATVGGRDDGRGTMSLVSPERSLTSGCDLVEKRIGVDSVFSLSAVAIREMVKRDGCDAAGVELVVGDSATHLDELSVGTLDAAALIDPYTSRALRSENAVVANLDDELCPDYGRCPISMVVAARDWAESNPDVVVRFQESLDASMFWIRQNGLEYRAELVSCCALTADDASEIFIPDFVGDRRRLNGDMPRLLEILMSQGQALSRDLTDELTR